MNKEKEILLQETYDTFIGIMLYDSPLTLLNKVTAGNLMGYGTTKDERVHDIDGLASVVMAQREQGAGLHISYDIQQLYKNISPDENAVVWVDEIKVCLQGNEVDNIIQVRVSYIFYFLDSQWKLVHWHASTGVEIENDTWHLNEWKQKNEALQKLVDEKTAELLNKNQELEIEAALEKVRSSSLAMKNSHELNEVVQVVFEKLKELGIPATAAAINIFDEGSNDMTAYVCGENENRLVLSQYRLPYFNNPISNDLLSAHQKGLDFFVGNYAQKETRAFYEQAFQLPELQDLPADIKEMIWESHQYTISVAGSQNSSLTINDFTGKQLPQTSIDIVKRFARVFEQAYTRFIDLQKAEAQAREAQIEAALERLRSRTMAMHQSAELRTVVDSIYGELKSLNVNFDLALIQLLKDNTKDLHLWVSTADGLYNDLIHWPASDLVNFEILYEARVAQGDFEFSLSPEELNAFFEEYFRLPYVPQERKAAVAGVRFLIVCGTYQKNTGVFLMKYSPGSYTAYEKDIVSRFSKVFEQTYTRFLDLQKAEAQAKEAQIEAALERVRSRSMAMHSSDELGEAGEILCNEIIKLGIETITSGFVIMDEEENIGWNYAPDPSTGKIMPVAVGIPHNDTEIMRSIKTAWKKQEPVFVVEMNEQETIIHQTFVAEKSIHFPISAEQLIAVSPPELKLHNFNFKEGYLLIVGGTRLTEEQEDMMLRFAKVFQQTYTRFLDLKKAEAQAREAQIESALERVRSLTMAMHSSEDVGKCIIRMFDELTSLGISKSTRAGIGIFNQENELMEIWTASKNQQDEYKIDIGVLDMTLHPLLVEARKTWKLKRPFNQFILEGEEVQNYYSSINSSPDYQPQVSRNHLVEKMFHYDFIFKQGLLFAFTETPLSDEQIAIFQRFTSVFNQTYTRYLDLQKAEAQAREAQIESALERVRAATMAMHNSDDVGKCTLKMFGELTGLGVAEDTRFGIGILNHENEKIQLWTAIKGAEEIKMHIGNLDMSWHPLLQSARKAWKEQISLHKYLLKGEELLNYYQMLNQAPDYKIQIPVEKLPEREFHYGFVFDQGFFYAFSPREIQPDLIHIIQRFSSLFSQTYRRYLDLKKAEAQAREAQIEAALERVRSKTMAMHSSQDVGNTMVVLFDELKDLGVHANRSGVLIMNPDRTSEIWTARAKPNGLVELFSWNLDMSMNDMTSAVYQGWEDQENLINYSFEGESRLEYYRILNASPEIPAKFNLDQLSEKEFTTACYFQEGGIYVFSPEMISKEHTNIIARFSSVFGQTYRRYLDLVMAETRTREAQIEAALERVRAKAMSMHKSADLSNASRAVFDELKQLGIVPLRSGVGLIDKSNRKATMYAAHSSAKGNTLNLIGEIKLSNHPVLDLIFEHWVKNEIFYPALNGEELKLYYDILLSSYEEMPKPAFSKQEIQHGCFIPFTHGSFYSWTKEPFEKEELAVLKRFTSVIDLTYKRFYELQQAEERAIEATRQASFDRVRGEIASMRTSSDLNRITPLVWQELTHLGVPFFRCGIFIIREDEKMVHAYLSTPTGEALAGLHIGFAEENIGMIKPSIENWRAQKVYTEEWDKERFLENMKNFIRRGDVKNPKVYQAGDAPPERLVLHLVPFKQGMLYVGNSELLTEEQMDLMKVLAKAFSIAYSRYEDFNALDMAKSKIENTLTELKAAQEQLVQQEKLASLGQLTAGIAHEIKNPLNFVNNFSDLSAELIEEVFGELDNLEDSDTKKEIIAILGDVKSNLLKVHEHGTRANGIVSSMLQHSRASGSKREPMAFNPLVKEFVNLSFHGMRAGKAPINVEIDLQLDEQVGEVTMIGEDFSRVILNLCNNAFDTMRDKLKAAGTNPDGYLPKLTVKTSLQKDKVIFSIGDNGSGIPKEIQDKILQPFFTTKKGTEGTGLGLSITHDIVKAHGGELKVETNEGKGTAFVISLPIV